MKAKKQVKKKRYWANVYRQPHNKSKVIGAVYLRKSDADFYNHDPLFIKTISFTL